MKNKEILNKTSIRGKMSQKSFSDEERIGAVKNETNQESDLKQNLNATLCLNTEDTGRSMTEMLGVLAVMGVLSVGGITGYQYAMNKYQTNQILNEINLISHLLATTLLNHNKSFTLSLESPYDNNRFINTPYSFEYGCGDSSEHPSTWHICDTNETAFFINIRVPNAICQNLINSNISFQYQTDFGVSVSCGNECLVDDTHIEWQFDITQTDRS